MTKRFAATAAAAIAAVGALAFGLSDDPIATFTSVLALFGR